MLLITDNDTLKQTCEVLSRSNYITIDTEFLREKTYYPQLCLIQIASDDVECMVDPLQKDLDLTPVFDLLQDQSITKVFHSGKQDIEIFFKLTGKIPTPVFDTQIAAMVCGFGAAASYASLVSDLVGKKLDKSSRFTDWSKRPLSKRQQEYAIGDVTHLRVIYRKLMERLDSTGRAEWVREELSSLLSPKTYQANLDRLWRKLCPKGYDAESASILKALVYWREEQAMLKNKPRSHILKDQTILEIAAIRPKDMVTLESLRSLGRSKVGLRSELLEVILSAEPMGSAELKSAGTLRLSAPSKSKPTIELLKVLLAQVASEKDVAEKLIAASDDLILIATGKYDETPSMRGWRYDIFGCQAKDLCEGRVGLAVVKRKIQTIPLG